MIYKIKNTFLNVNNNIKEYEEFITGRFSQFEIYNKVETENYINFNEDSVEIQYRNYSTDSEITKLFKNSFTLNKMSHGNNVSFLNA